MAGVPPVSDMPKRVDLAYLTLEQDGKLIWAAKKWNKEDKRYHDGNILQIRK